jgi:formylmethanofuran dehydrogenase subunit E
MTYEEIIRFHGHECPGLAIGYRMATAAMESLVSLRAEDEELVAIVENDACGVDALQCVTGCTFGKGNLQFRDYGKKVYTLYARSTRRGVRVYFHGKGIPESLGAKRHDIARWILSAEYDSILSVTPVSISEPEPARIMESTPCGFCGESVMESRIQRQLDKPACIPCYEKLQKHEQNASAEHRFARVGPRQHTEIKDYHSKT